MAAMSWRCLVCGSAADAGGLRVLLLFRFLLRIFFVQLRIFETGADPCGSCELIEVAQELDDVVATCGRAPVIVTPVSPGTTGSSS